MNLLFWKKDNIVNQVTEPIQEGAKDKGALSYVYNPPTIYGVTLRDWMQSVETAWSDTNPDRIDLADIYKAICSYDSQAIAGMTQRKLYTLQGSFAFYNENGSINEEATKLIKTPSGSTQKWFRNFMSYALDSIFWGFEVISLNVVNGKILVKKIPERNVIPNRHIILKDTRISESPDNILEYTKGSLDLITCKISYTDDLNDLGLLNGVAPYFFSKVLQNWKMHADKFGMLTRVMKTSSENKQKLEGSYKAMESHVRSNFIVLGPDDSLTFEGDTRTGMAIYKELNEYCDANISKILLGQTSTTDQKAFVGSAEVHENVLNKIITSDKEFIESVINDQLIPKLQVMGLLPQRIYFGFSEQVDLKLKEKAEIIKTLSDAGYNVDPEYIKETFDLPLIEKTENNGENNTTSI